ncbi:MAG: hypothetical protein ACI9SY_000585 [Candidatus Paceibacteria bacterium]|jgi:hypothetical protein
MRPFLFLGGIMSSIPTIEKGYPKNPVHGDVYEGEVYGETLDQWMTQAEFDAWYTVRSSHLRYE